MISLQLLGKITQDREEEIVEKPQTARNALKNAPLTLGWSRNRRRYKCLDGTSIAVPLQRPEFVNPKTDEGDEDPDAMWTCALKNGVYYTRRYPLCTFVSKTELDRDMKTLQSTPKRLKTFSFPRSVRKAAERALKARPVLRSVVLNEGLERLEQR